jgi:hypothetical protein
MPLLGVLVTIATLLVSPSTAAAQMDAAPSGTELTYLKETAPFRERFRDYQDQLADYQKAAAQGQLDEIAVTALGDLTRELFIAHATFLAASPSARLDQYDRTIKLALDRAYQSGLLLLRAQVTDSAPERTALMRTIAAPAGAASTSIRPPPRRTASSPWTATSAPGS